MSIPNCLNNRTIGYMFSMPNLVEGNTKTPKQHQYTHSITTQVSHVSPDCNSPTKCNTTTGNPTFSATYTFSVGASNTVKKDFFNTPVARLAT